MEQAANDNVWCITKWVILYHTIAIIKLQNMYEIPI